MVGVKTGKAEWTTEDSLDELAQLALTAGAEVVGTTIQRLSKPNPNHYLGKGKLQELVKLCPEVGYDVVIFDDELSPLQQRNIEEALKLKVIDRTALILDIFGRRAKTREGRLQVELAQHQYLLPRLAGQWSHLERLGGGIGTRGPGETQLETDRRLIRQRISHLKDEIEQVRKHRALYRRHRRRQGLPVVAIVGYTNAGKSTLLNALSHADVLVEDKLFATLDPTTRQLILANGRRVLITDTVGFIQKLPATIIAAFRATLEELEEADLLLHVIDMTHKNAVEQNRAVEGILKELKLEEKPRVTALNKVDLVAAEELAALVAKLVSTDAQPYILISAARNWGLNRLAEVIAETLDSGGTAGPREKHATA